MKAQRCISTLAVCSLFIGCDAPTAPSEPSRGGLALDRAPSANGVCHPVRFHSVAEWFVDEVTVAGTFTGDVQGSFVAQLDPSTLKLVGKTARFEGSATFTITGGALPASLPLVFTTTFAQKNLLHETPGSPATVAEQLVTFRSTSEGVRANLAMHGSFDGVTATVDHDWWGVICP